MGTNSSVGIELDAEMFDGFSDERVIGNAFTEKNALQFGKGLGNNANKVVQVNTWIVVDFEIVKTNKANRGEWFDSRRLSIANHISEEIDFGQIFQGRQLRNEIFQCKFCILKKERGQI